MSAQMLAGLSALLPSNRLLTERRDMARFVTDWRGRFCGAALAVVQPRTTEELAAIARLCTRERMAMVPQGGNTGLCGGATPNVQPCVLVSFDRMNAVRSFDGDGGTLTVEAGCILADVQRHAEDRGFLFPLSLAAEGSAQIGGLLSTNAGGTAVLKYGCARDLVLGIEAVLPGGEIWNGLRSLRKDNTGYDLKQSLIGAEGTLGFITAAVLKLFPRARRRVTALLALDSLDAALAVFREVRDGAAERLTAFEVFSRDCLDMVLAQATSARDPLGSRHPWYALLEVGDAWADSPLDVLLEDLLAGLMSSDALRDATLAKSESQRAALWALREQISEAQRVAGYALKFDVSLPIGQLPAFVRETTAALTAAFPGLRVAPFGHLGDGNVHFNVAAPAGADERDITAIVYGAAMRRNGSFSAEHGIGQLKVRELRQFKSSVELDLMVRLKSAFDPLGLMNPGKVLGEPA
jgi:FAD/FMN-containing dehydrogenase